VRTHTVAWHGKRINKNCLFLKSPHPGFFDIRFRPIPSRAAWLASALRLVGVLVVTAVIAVVWARRWLAASTTADHRSGNLGKSGVGESDGIDPRTKAPDLSRVLVAVNKCSAVVGRLDFVVAVSFCFFFEAGCQQQGGGTFIVNVGNVVGEATRAVLVLAFGSVIRRKGQRVEGGQLVFHVCGCGC
jgi:hypothetical protein